ncbi:MAG: hypothetical protein MUC60_19115, partial [Oscillatoria sp. Prado101]|nr:hypothetical protein [Oscillatoria sp. Prado101]
MANITTGSLLTSGFSAVEEIRIGEYKVKDSAGEGLADGVGGADVPVEVGSELESPVRLLRELILPLSSGI